MLEWKRSCWIALPSGDGHGPRTSWGEYLWPLLAENIWSLLGGNPGPLSSKTERADRGRSFPSILLAPPVQWTSLAEQWWTSYALKLTISRGREAPGPTLQILVVILCRQVPATPG